MDTTNNNTTLKECMIKLEKLSKYNTNYVDELPELIKSDYLLHESVHKLHGREITFGVKKYYKKMLKEINNKI